MALKVVNAELLVIVWYELHRASPPISCSTVSICSGLSMQYTEKPSASNCLFRLTCRGRSVLPGAFSSMKAILPPGRSTSRSGTPSKPGLVNFGARPPFVRTVCTNFVSIVFSRIVTSHVLKTRKALYTRKCVYRVFTALYSFFFRYIRKVRNKGTRLLIFFAAYGAAAVPMRCSHKCAERVWFSPEPVPKNGGYSLFHWEHSLGTKTYCGP